MKKQLITVFLCLIIAVSCEETAKNNDYYGQCEKGDTRCSGEKLEGCSSYGEWTLLKECDAFGGECVSEDGLASCVGMENDGEVPDTYINDWGEDEVDDENTGSDGSLWPDFGNEDDDAADGDTDEETDEDMTDIDAVDEDIVQAVCGNSIVEEGEVCEKGTLKNCIEIDPELYSGGKAFCLDDCSGYNLLTCDEKETGDGN